MTVGSQQFSITSTRSVIAQAPAGSGAGPVGALFVTNTSAVTAYIGGVNVTSSNGYPLAQNASLSTYLWPGDVVYAVTASGTATLPVLQT